MSAGVIIPKLFAASLCKAWVDDCWQPTPDQKGVFLNAR